ncbi:MAG TPA: DNA-processing protein DprA [Saprospiraceae bacterium]|nr:DNA-processing protein DprA [Saprospiraceae bacterium]
MSLLHQIALTLVPQVGAMTAKTLVSYCGSAEAVFQASQKELLRIPGIGPVVIQSILQSVDALKQAEQELRYLDQYGIQALFYTDPQYPARLRQSADSPALLFFKGSSLQLMEKERIVAVVGTRQPSDHGKTLCEALVEGFLPYNVLLVSGLAFGVDVTAHRKAVSLGMPNIGVLGHGLGSIYPAQHRSVALRMIENGGLLSEYAHDALPDREHFPMRNRIISGMSDLVLVVETAASGGSMITVQFAERQGREVFAIPGRPGDAKSIGCNYLIKAERAKLAESAADIAYRMGWEEAGQNKQGKLFHDLSDTEEKLVGIIRNQPDIPIDRLTVEAGLEPGLLASRILDLEFKGIIRTLPGKRYRVC